MTERDLIRSVVEKSITLKVDIEELRKWAKEKYAKAVREMKIGITSIPAACLETRYTHTESSKARYTHMPG